MRIGIDWAESFHDVALGRPGEGVIEKFRVEHSAAGWVGLGKAVPGGEVYLSFPGLGDRLAARIGGEIGDYIEQFDTPNALQCYAGAAPVTRRSGRSELVIARRLAHNRYLGVAVH